MSEVSPSLQDFRCGKEYLIKWSGLNEHGHEWDDTWEPAEYIEKDEAEALEIFLAKRKSLDKETDIFRKFILYDMEKIIDYQVVG